MQRCPGLIPGLLRAVQDPCKQAHVRCYCERSGSYRRDAGPCTWDTQCAPQLSYKPRVAWGHPSGLPDGQGCGTARNWSPPRLVLLVALVHSPPASREEARAAVRSHPLVPGTITEVGGTVSSWHSGPHLLPQNPTPANRPAEEVTPPPPHTRSKAEACKCSPTASDTSPARK